MNFPFFCKKGKIIFFRSDNYRSDYQNIKLNSFDFNTNFKSLIINHLQKTNEVKTGKRLYQPQTVKVKQKKNFHTEELEQLMYFVENSTAVSKTIAHVLDFNISEYQDIYMTLDLTWVYEKELVRASSDTSKVRILVFTYNEEDRWICSIVREHTRLPGMVPTEFYLRFNTVLNLIIEKQTKITAFAYNTAITE